MIRIGILGNIGSGKSYVAKNFGFPVFNADLEVSRLYQNDKSIYKNLSKCLPNYIFSFPIKKTEITKAILGNKKNLRTIIKIVHKEVRKKMELFLKKNKNKKIIILDIPLMLENKMNHDKDILVFVDSKKIDIEKNIKKRPNFNRELYNKFKKIQFSSMYKKKKSNFIIKNNFKSQTVKREIKKILSEIL